jgi:membrane fusion protein, copper/silver efflux system
MTVEKVLAIPISAVINTGVRKIAYRQGDPGMFDMVEVVVGPRAGEFYPVLAGLRPGDQVATAGSFLVDAENRLNPAASSQYFGASGGPQGGEPPSHAGHQH